MGMVGFKNYEVGFAYLLKATNDVTLSSSYSSPSVEKVTELEFFQIELQTLLTYLYTKTGSTSTGAVLVKVRAVDSNGISDWSTGIYTEASEIRAYKEPVPAPSSNPTNSGNGTPTSSATPGVTPSPTPTSTSAPAPTPTPPITITSIFGRPYQNTSSTWYIPLTNSSTEAIPSYSSLQIKVGASEWTDIGAGRSCGSYGCGAIVSGFVDVCPQFRFVGRTNGFITTIWEKSPSSGGTCG